MMGYLCSLGTSQNKQPKIQRNTLRYQQILQTPDDSPYPSAMAGIFSLAIQSVSAKMRGNPESRLFQQLKYTVRQSFLQLKLPIKNLPLYIERYCGLNPVTMRVCVMRLVVFTTRAGEIRPSFRLWPMCWRMKYRDSTGTVQTKRMKRSPIHRSL